MSHDVALTPENTTYHYDSGPRIENGRLATWMFLAAETLFFSGLLSAWLVLRSTTPDWSAGESPSLVIAIVMTGMLVTASWFGHSAVSAAKQGDARGVAVKLMLATVLAAVFLGTQAWEYQHLVHGGIEPSTSVRWGVFYAITTCHGIHVAIGVLWLVVLLVRAARTGLVGERSGPLEYGVLYLHFVDVVWLLIVVLLYVVQ